MAVSPSIVSGRVVAMTIFSSDPSMWYAKLVMTPNSNFSDGSYPGTWRSVRPVSSFWSTSRFDRVVFIFTPGDFIKGISSLVHSVIYSIWRGGLLGADGRQDGADSHQCTRRFAR